MTDAGIGIDIGIIGGSGLYAMEGLTVIEARVDPGYTDSALTVGRDRSFDSIASSG